ncbi:hypothetical protein J6590_073900 [Homalodisca vitripennis]|nr:hypothetical protein J6590_073900 [Homalodisca vitripennis]
MAFLSPLRCLQCKKSSSIRINWGRCGLGSLSHSAPSAVLFNRLLNGLRIIVTQTALGIYCTCKMWLELTQLFSRLVDGPRVIVTPTFGTWCILYLQTFKPIGSFCINWSSRRWPESNSYSDCWHLVYTVPANFQADRLVLYKLGKMWLEFIQLFSRLVDGPRVIVTPTVGTWCILYLQTFKPIGSFRINWTKA